MHKPIIKEKYIVLHIVKGEIRTNLNKALSKEDINNLISFCV